MKGKIENSIFYRGKRLTAKKRCHKQRAQRGRDGKMMMCKIINWYRSQLVYVWICACVVCSLVMNGIFIFTYIEFLSLALEESVLCLLVTDFLTTWYILSICMCDLWVFFSVFLTEGWSVSEFGSGLRSWDGLQSGQTLQPSQTDSAHGLCQGTYKRVVVFFFVSETIITSNGVIYFQEQGENLSNFSHTISQHTTNESYGIW